MDDSKNYVNPLDLRRNDENAVNIRKFWDFFRKEFKYKDENGVIYLTKGKIRYVETCNRVELLDKTENLISIGFEVTYCCKLNFIGFSYNLTDYNNKEEKTLKGVYDFQCLHYSIMQYAGWDYASVDSLLEAK